MFAQKFFKLFPPPKFLDIPYAGLDISDDAVRCVEYSHTRHGLVIHRYGIRTLPPGTVEGGEIKNDTVLKEAVASLCGELKIYAVKASLPEERMYIFKTEVPSKDEKEIRENVMSKLEENVPLAAGEAIFFFSKIPGMSENTISVSVAPRPLVISYLEVIKAAGVTVLSFEMQARAIARTLIPAGATTTEMIVYIMNNKTGIYVVCGGVACFTSTIPWGNTSIDAARDPKLVFGELKRQLQQVREYWVEHGQGEISRIVFAGKGALADGLLSECSAGFSDDKAQSIRFEIGKVWQNAFSYDAYIPPIAYEESLEYAVAAGLALPALFSE